MSRAMGYGEALDLALQGSKAQRSGWNGKGMHVELAAGAVLPDGRQIEPFLMLRTADGKWVPWTVSQTDCTAFDWQILE